MVSVLKSIASTAAVLSCLLHSASAASEANVTATSYKFRTYSEIVDTILALETKYPTFTEVFTVQDKYGLPQRSELKCVRSGVSGPCLHYVIKITDESTLPDPSRPEVFFSGALHGDERVGPQSVVALAELLLDHAGRDDGNPWIKRLVATRTIVIMPTTNAYGYEKNTREEGSIDPNRDFPYSKGSTCFQSMVARAVNEVWRDHLFQLSITFHGGTRSVSYEWGSNNHVLSGGSGSQISPDDKGQFYLGKAMSRFGGKFQEDSTYYPDGRMNDIVYAVDGGMEDWAYAASWENDYTTPKPIGVCNPSTYGGYASTKSVYNTATHRSFNILVETSTSKSPTTASLGDSSYLSDAALADYLPTQTTLGHVPRNVRLSLLYIDIVQPYVTWKTTPPTAAGINTAVSVQWEVAGSITVDSTQVKTSSKSDMSSATLSAVQSGVTRWYHADMGTSTKPNNKGLFTTSLTFTSAGTYYVQAIAIVDQDWAKQTGTVVPNVKPQSHVVNARTNTNWSYSNSGKSVKGQTVWNSPVRFVSYYCADAFMHF